MNGSVLSVVDPNATIRGQKGKAILRATVIEAAKKRIVDMVEEEHLALKVFRQINTVWVNKGLEGTDLYDRAFAQAMDMEEHNSFRIVKSDTYNLR